MVVARLDIMHIRDWVGAQFDAISVKVMGKLGVSPMFVPYEPYENP